MHKTIIIMLTMFIFMFQLYSINIPSGNQDQIIKMNYTTFGGFRVSGVLFNRPMIFMLDMGANINFVNSKHSKYVKSPLFFKGNGFQKKGYRCNYAPFIIQGNEVGCKFYFFDFLKIPLDNNHELDAIVGQLFIKKFLTYFNFSNNTVMFLKNRGQSLRKMISNQSKSSLLSFTQKQNVIVIPVRINGKSLNLQIDTGLLNTDIHLYNSSKLRRSGLFSHVLKNKNHYTSIRADITGKCFKTIEYISDDIYLGNIHEKKVSVTIDKKESTDSFCDGTIGVRMLQRFNIVFDFKIGKVIFEQHGKDISKFNLYKIGANITRHSNGRAFFLFIKPNSDIDKAGIKPGDEILEVGGKKISQYNYFSLMKSLYGKIGTKIKLLIKTKDGISNHWFMPLK